MNKRQWELINLDFNNLTREQAIALVGIETVKAVEKVKPEVGHANEYNEITDKLPWYSSIEIDLSKLTPEQAEIFRDINSKFEAVYYTTSKDAAKIPGLYDNFEIKDWDAIKTNWRIHHYRIVYNSIATT